MCLTCRKNSTVGLGVYLQFQALLDDECEIEFGQRCVQQQGVGEERK